MRWPARTRCAGPHGRAVDGDESRADELLEMVARELRHRDDDRLVEPLAVLAFGNGRDPFLDGRVVAVVAVRVA